MKIYKPNRKGFIIYVLAGLALLPLASLTSIQQSIASQLLAFFSLSIPFAIVLWTYISTSYAIENKTLRYKSGLLHGNIEITKIREIHHNTTMWAGTSKAATSRKGMIIKYNKFDELYISPVNNEEMISDLLLINKDIQVSKEES